MSAPTRRFRPRSCRRDREIARHCLSKCSLAGTGGSNQYRCGHGVLRGEAGAGPSTNNGILIGRNGLPIAASAYVQGDHAEDAGAQPAMGRVGCSRFANHWQPQQPSSRLSCPCLRARPAQPTRCKPARLDTAASTMDSDLPAGTASATIAPAVTRGNGWSEERRDLSRKSRISGSYPDSVGHSV